MSNSLVKLSSVSGNYHDSCPLFITRSDICVCAAGSVINVISSKTGELIGSFNGHKASVSSIKQLNTVAVTNKNRANMNDIYVISSSLDGVICLWNLETFSIISTKRLHYPVFDILLLPTPVDISPLLSKTEGEKISKGSVEIFAVITNDISSMDKDGNVVVIKQNDKNSVKVVTYDLVSEKIKDFSGLMYHDQASRKQPTVALLNTDSKTSFLVTASKKKVTFYNAKNSSIKQKLVSEKRGNITSIAVCDQTGTIVTGHEYGEITVWRDAHRFAVSGKESAVTKTTLHWHAHGVSALDFSPDGRYLYSCGQEGVLVVWKLDNLEKAFFPRLGAPVTHLTTTVDVMGGVKVAVTTTDNALRIINTSTMREDWSVRSVCATSRADSVFKRADKKGPNATSLPFMQSDSAWNCLLKVEPRSQLVVCNGYPGQLQAFNMVAKSIANAYQVVNYTRISKKESYSKIYVPSITHFEFVSTASGHHYLVSVDVRKGEELEAETSLKFWEWNAEQATYRLSAQMDSPHATARVTCITTSTASDDVQQVLCATASVDGTVKMWRGTRNYLTVPEITADGTTAVPSSLKWTCTYSFKYRDCPANSLTFSRDGSLLAVAYQNLVTLWDPVRVQLKGSLVGSSANNIIYSAFIEPNALPQQGGGSGTALLVLGTRRGLSVFDLLTMKPVWSVAGHFNSFAVAQNENETIDLGADKVAWIAASVTVKAKTTTETDGESTGQSDAEVSEWEDDVAGGSATGTAHKVLFFGLKSNKVLASSGISAKINSMVFTHDTTAFAKLLLVTESSELLQISSSESDSANVSNGQTGVQMAKVAGTKLPSLSATNLEFDASSEMAIVAQEKLGNVRNPVHANKGWLRAIFDESSENIPSLSAVCDEFMDGLLRMKKPTAKTAKPSAAVSNVVHSVTPVAAVETHSPMLVEDDLPMNFAADDEFESSLLACFNSTGALAVATPAKPTTTAAAPATPAPKSAKKGKKTVETVEPESEAESDPVVAVTPAVVVAPKSSRKSVKPAVVAQEQEAASEAESEAVVVPTTPMAPKSTRKSTRPTAAAVQEQEVVVSDSDYFKEDAAAAALKNKSKTPKKASAAAPVEELVAPVPVTAVAGKTPKKAAPLKSSAATTAALLIAQNLAEHNSAAEDGVTRRSSRKRAGSNLSEVSDAASVASSVVSSTEGTRKSARISRA